MSPDELWWLLFEVLITITFTITMQYLQRRNQESFDGLPMYKRTTTTGGIFSRFCRC